MHNNDIFLHLNTSKKYSFLSSTPDLHNNKMDKNSYKGLFPLDKTIFLNIFNTIPSYRAVYRKEIVLNSFIKKNKIC